MMIRVTILVLMLIGCSVASAQKADTLIQANITKVKSPKKASRLSAIFPGAGQIYNEKYWKLPIIYGGLGALVYSASFNYSNYQTFKDAYIAKVDDDPSTVDEFPFSSESAVQQQYQSFRNRFELSIIGMLGIYFLNIVDAAVDAHLYEFNVSNDLSMRIQPSVQPTGINPNQNMLTLSVQLNFKK